MLCISDIISFLLALPLELGLTACGTEAPAQPHDDTVPPAQAQEMPEDSEAALAVTEGTEYYRGFLMDNVLHAPEGDIHYHIYVPDSYDGSSRTPCFSRFRDMRGFTSRAWERTCTARTSPLKR